jgi:hypothetical protein
LPNAARHCLATLAALLALAALTSVPAGARTLHTVLQDDNLALFSPRSLPQFVAELRWLGVDELRVSAEWKLEAPDPGAARPPAGFDPSDPAAYSSSSMRLLDRAVRAAARAGLQVIVDPAFSAPRWATSGVPSGPSRSDPWYVTGINVDQLAAWEVMLARRYSGTFIPAGERTPLPRVAIFTLWNEPNERGYLAPQWQHGVPVSADWYRRLLEVAYPAIKRVAPYATILIGNTSAAGADLEAPTGGVPPLQFIRRLACVDAALRPVHDGACAHFRTLPADGYSQHPYERDAPPWVPSGAGHPDWGQMGDLPRLQGLLDRLVAMHRLAPGARNLWLTEQGYESNAQLSDEPWSEAQQAQLDADAEYLAWRDPSVQSFSQFLLRDTLTEQTLTRRRQTANPSALLPGTWTTGLERQDGAPKPALSMFRSPIVARVASGELAPAGATGGPAISSAIPIIAPAVPLELEVWGRARPARAPTLVQVQLSEAPGGTFRLARELSTDASGIFDVTLPVPAARPLLLRFQWLDDRGGWQTSPSTAPQAFPG